MWERYSNENISALVPKYGDMPIDCLVGVFLVLVHALIDGLAQHGLFATMHQRTRLGHVGHITSRANESGSQHVGVIANDV